MPKPSDPANSITAKYDAWNRLVEVSDGGTLVARFRYDGEGRRILKIFDSNSPSAPNGLDTYEHVFLDDQQVVETREGSGATPAQAETLQPKYQHVWSPRYIDSLILRDENTDQDGLCDDERIYYLADANYNVTALVDTNGDALERYIYSPYGEVTVLDTDFTADADGISDYANATLYTGREVDAATGLYFYRARYYHTRMGQFVARDSASYLGGGNVYNYGSDAPLTALDPSGNLCIEFDPPNYQGCGKAIWRAEFQLGKDEQNGFLIQKVTTGFDIRQCGGSGILCSAVCGTWITDNEEKCAELVYWELWSIVDGKAFTAMSGMGGPFPATREIDLSDRFSPPVATTHKTKGSYVQKGQAVFIPGNPLNQADVPDGDWKLDVGGAAHILWYSCTEPKAWATALSEQSGKVERDWRFGWDCCCEPPDEPKHGPMKQQPLDHLLREGGWEACGRCKKAE